MKATRITTRGLLLPIPIKPNVLEIAGQVQFKGSHSH